MFFEPESRDLLKPGIVFVKKISGCLTARIRTDSLRFVKIIAVSMNSFGLADNPASTTWRGNSKTRKRRAF